MLEKPEPVISKIKGGGGIDEQHYQQLDYELYGWTYFKVNG